MLTLFWNKYYVSDLEGCRIMEVRVYSMACNDVCVSQCDQIMDCLRMLDKGGVRIWGFHCSLMESVT